MYLSENGDYSPATVSASTSPSLGTGDIALSVLAQRSLVALRKFFPRVVLSTSGTSPAVSTSFFYDFNGNGTNDGAYILQGEQCLVFFLGGVPLYDAASQTYAMTGFGKDPTNPFSNNNPAATYMYNANRQPPFFEFATGRLFADPTDVGSTSLSTVISGMPAYYDSLGNSPPTNGLTLNFFAYFNAYGSNAYDPNDVNFPLEADATGNSPITLSFYAPSSISSASPNPYTSTTTVTYNATTNTGGPPAVTFQNPQTFQIISSGLDGLYGVGGQYLSNTTTAGTPLPIDSTTTTSPYSTTDATIRQREGDNLTNFKSGSLQ